MPIAMLSKRSILPVVCGAIGLAWSALAPTSANADGAAEAAERAERCATRLSISLLGTGATPALLADPNPQASIEKMLAAPAFVERFARFVNAEFNPQPGVTVAEDASYTLAKHVLTNDLPWKTMFVGAFDVTDKVVADPKGLGYFRSDAWLKRYEGNEPQGYRISTAYRILQNTTGLTLSAVTNVEGADLTAKGREAAGCRGCHYDNWYALDKVARVLPKKDGKPTGDGAQQILGGKTIADDAALVTALVESVDYRVRSTRLAFAYLYGRSETACEADVFAKGLAAFEAAGSIKAAVAAIANDSGFCQ